MPNHSKRLRSTARVGDRERDVTVERLDDGRWRVVLDGVERAVDARPIDGGGWSLLVDGEAWVVDVDPGKDGEQVVETRSAVTRVKLVDPRRGLLAGVAGRARTAGGPDPLRAPIPGKVVKVLAKVGEAVAAGQGLVVVEAMKMENELRAVRDGVVRQIHVVEGQAVEAQETLVTLE